MFYRKTDDLLIVETTAQLPTSLIDQKQLYYLYILERSDPNDANRVIETEEKLLTELKQVRLLNLDLKKYSKKNTSFQTIFLQFDGLVFFDNNFDYKSENNIREEKKRHLQLEEPIEKLKKIENIIDYAEKAWVIFDNIHRLFECLCYNDDVYKQIFEQVSLFFKFF